MLNSLFSTSSARTIYVSISPSIGLEVLEIDHQGQIKNYAQDALEYDDSQRKILSYDSLREKLEKIFQARNINPVKAQICLSLPVVWFGYHEELPLLLDDSAITNVALSDLDKSYIFKREEAVPVWFDALKSDHSDSRSIFYTAVQASAVNQLKEVFASFNAVLTKITCSFTSILKGLNISGLASDYMNNDSSSWLMMVINNNGYQLYAMQGKKLISYSEDPLPIRSFDKPEEAYEQIENSLQITLLTTPADALVIVSETDLLSAEILCSRIKTGQKTIPIENNLGFKKTPIMDVGLNVFEEDQLKVSLGAVGIVAPDDLLPENLRINFLDTKLQKGASSAADVTVDIPIGSTVITLTPLKATILSLGLAAVVGVVVGLPYMFFGQQVSSLTDKSSQLDQEIQTVDAELKQYEGSGGATSFDPVKEIEKVLQSNKTKIMTYSAIGETIPRNLYITYFMTGGDGMVNIKGCASSVEDVYVFFKNLKESLGDTKLRLSKLDLVDSSLDDVITSATISPIDNSPYLFEITNMDEAQLTSFTNKLLGKENVNPSQSGGDMQQGNQNNSQNNGQNGIPQAGGNNANQTAPAPGSN